MPRLSKKDFKLIVINIFKALQKKRTGFIKISTENKGGKSRIECAFIYKQHGSIRFSTVY